MHADAGLIELNVTFEKNLCRLLVLFVLQAWFDGSWHNRFRNDTIDSHLLEKQQCPKMLND